MREFEIKPELERILNKIYKKDRQLYEQVMKKIEEIVNISDVEHYKNLRFPLQHLKRVHVGSFVLIFSYNKSKDFISIVNFDHHDKIYK